MQHGYDMNMYGNNQPMNEKMMEDYNHEKKMHDFCKKYKYHYVMMETHDGNVYDGIIDKVENGQVYMLLPMEDEGVGTEGTQSRYGGYGGYGGYSGYGGYRFPRRFRRFRRFRFPFFGIRGFFFPFFY